MKHYGSIAEIVKSRRDSLGITQEALAEIAGVGLRTLKAFETGNGNPTIETIDKLANALGLEFTLVIKGIKPEA